jgi:hypothetical protein
MILGDDASVLICNKNSDDFCSMSNLVFSLISNLFTSYKLVLNLDKTNVIKSVMNNSPWYAY